jgi:signal transduction histidine kinase
MNTMLGRLEEAATRQRSFVSDAAHELRSPVTSIRAELEVAGARPQAVDWDALVGRLTTITMRMEHLVEDLLVSATADELTTLKNVDVDLDEIVLRRIETLRATTALAVDAQRIDGARVLGDRNALERVVANLIDNAEQHARTTIGVELRAVDGVAELVVTDDGLGVPAHLRERVFERFARVDDVRDRRHGGAGLGLSIARHIVEAHHGTIGFADDTSRTRVVVRLPLPAMGASTAYQTPTS